MRCRRVVVMSLCVHFSVQPFSYLLQASVFERDDVALPRVASFFHQDALKQEREAEAMLGYLAERGGSYCGKDIQVRTNVFLLYDLFTVVLPGCFKLTANTYNL